MLGVQEQASRPGPGTNADRPMAPGRIFCGECGDHHVPGDHDEGWVIPEPSSVLSECERLHMALAGTADPLPATTVRQTRAWIQGRLDAWREPVSEYDGAVRTHEGEPAQNGSGISTHESAREVASSGGAASPAAGGSKAAGREEGAL